MNGTCWFVSSTFSRNSKSKRSQWISLSFLHARLRTSTLHHDEEGQAVLINLLLRNYLHYNLYDQVSLNLSRMIRLEGGGGQYLLVKHDLIVLWVPHLRAISWWASLLSLKVLTTMRWPATSTTWAGSRPPSWNTLPPTSTCYRFTSCSNDTLKSCSLYVHMCTHSPGYTQSTTALCHWIQADSSKVCYCGSVAPGGNPW